MQVTDLHYSAFSIFKISVLSGDVAEFSIAIRPLALPDVTLELVYVRLTVGTVCTSSVGMPASSFLP